eukprot:TRINITY_DN50799_c0_g1_i1.p1 TRINITY_DN50799_c0_g1~~TRINITY_DN50799_c0_g1_i1.p1  ORF type:complete len:945 (-),score=68.65 TRINITY_DN50799_c0_g1_i1:42-2876(-)
MASKKKEKTLGFPWVLRAILIGASLVLTIAFFVFSVRQLDARSLAEGADRVSDIPAPTLSRPAALSRPPAPQQPSLQAHVEGHQLTAQVKLELGSPVKLDGFVWQSENLPEEPSQRFQMDVHGADPTLLAVRRQGQGAELTGCTVVGVGRSVGSSAQLDCGGARVDFQTTIVDVSGRGAALRWKIHLHDPVDTVALAMWLPGAAVEGTVDGSPVTSRHRPEISTLSLNCQVTASSYSQGRTPNRLVDGDGETEWFAGKGETQAWIELDLKGERVVSEVRLQWWAASIADDWQLLSRGSDPSEGWTQRASSRSTKRPHENFNAWQKMAGWSEQCRYIRLEMNKGHKDPWGFGVNFGIRSFDVLGRDAAATAGTSELWAASSDTKPSVHPVAYPGIWLALEHPRARCEVSNERVARRRTGEAVWRRVQCELSVSQNAIDGEFLDISGSLGIFEDAPQSQLRRVFQGYLKKARGWPFRQILHYNSWYDLASRPCDQTSPSCYLHPMDEKHCSERLAAFNGNLSRHGGSPLDAILLDDGWDDWYSLWDIDRRSFPAGFDRLLAEGKRWGTRMGVWMSPFGGYGEAGAARVESGVRHGYERSARGTFSLAGPNYFATFRGVVERRIEEGFGLFKFDGLGGGLGQRGGEAYRDDFEAMLSLIRGVRRKQQASQEKVWISLTIGTWPSPFWLLWGDSIWRDGPDVGQEGVGSARERWLTFRDAALRRALNRGPLFPMAAFMQHGIVWSRARETVDMWPSTRADTTLDFCNEALSFFLSGTGLQELYLQLELMEPRHWQALGGVVSFARKNVAILADAHVIGGYPVSGEAYGAAALHEGDSTQAARGIFWWRNPSSEVRQAKFQIADIFELPRRVLYSGACWSLRAILIDSSGCHWPDTPALEVEQGATLGASACAMCPRTSVESYFEAHQRLSITLEPFSIHAWEATHSKC